MEVKRDFIYDPSLVLYLPLYELDGASFMSRDAYGHLATVTGALWTPQGGRFDGADDLVNCGNNLVTSFPTAPFSLEAWIKLNGTGTGKTILNRGLINVDGWQFWVLLNERLAFYSWNPVAGTITATSFIANATWTHVAAVRLGAAVLLYKNGAIAPLDDAGNHSAIGGNTRNLLIGSHDDGSAPFNGTIGEVRVYNRALTPVEIQHNYLATKWRYQ